MLKEEILIKSGMLKNGDLYQLYESISKSDLEVLEEGLKFFKKSKQLYRFADKIERTMARATDKGNLEKGHVLRELVKDLRNLAKKYDSVEQDFAKKEISRADAKNKLNSLKIENQNLLDKLKKNNVKNIFKKIGLGALIFSVIALLGAGGKSLVDMLSITTLKTASDFYPKF